MNSKLRTFFLKSIPYLLSIAGGLTIFIVSSDEIHDENLNDLINNISASLLSIPLVFLLYDYSNYLISRRMNKTLAAGMIGRVNSIMQSMQATLRMVAGVRGNVSWGMFEEMLARRKISLRNIKITSAVATQLQSYRDQLDDVVFRTAQTSTLARQQIQLLSQMAREISHVIDTHKFHGTRATYVKHLENIMIFMGDWYDSIGGDPTSASPHTPATPNP